jgi:hypothetical protein
MVGPGSEPLGPQHGPAASEAAGQHTDSMPPEKQSNVITKRVDRRFNVSNNALAV